jgi:hypothetical protein
MKAQADPPCTDPVVAVAGRTGGSDRSRLRIAPYSSRYRCCHLRRHT